MKTDKLIILNEVERPCMHLICRIMPDGKINYVSTLLRKHYPNLKRSRGWATLKTFGFVVENGKFILKNESKAKYFNGTQRRWQGREEFTYNEIMQSKKWSD